MSELVAVALITGGLTLAGSLAAQWLSSRAERQRARLQFEANLKAKLMDYEREDRVLSVRAIREYLSGLDEALSAVPLEGLRQDPQRTVLAWHHSITAHLTRGIGPTRSVGEGELRDCLQQLVVKVPAFTDAVRDWALAPPGSAQEPLAEQRWQSGLDDLVDLLTKTYGCLDRYGRAVQVPGF